MEWATSITVQHFDNVGGQRHAVKRRPRALRLGRTPPATTVTGRPAVRPPSGRRRRGSGGVSYLEVHADAVRHDGVANDRRGADDARAAEQRLHNQSGGRLWLDEQIPVGRQALAKQRAADARVRGERSGKAGSRVGGLDAGADAQGLVMVQQRVDVQWPLSHGQCV